MTSIGDTTIGDLLPNLDGTLDNLWLEMEMGFYRITEEEHFRLLVWMAAGLIPGHVPYCNMLQCRVLRAMSSKATELGMMPINPKTLTLIDEQIAKGLN